MFSPFGTHIDAPVERFGVPQLYRMRSVDADASFSGPGYLRHRSHLQRTLFGASLPRPSLLSAL
jgi:hypothetical protein